MTTLFKAQFRELKERTLTLKDEDIDQRFRGVVNKINSYPNMATVWCCTGHNHVSELTLPYMVIVSEDENDTALALVRSLQKLWNSHLDKMYYTPMECSLTSLFSMGRTTGQYYHCVDFRLINRAKSPDMQGFRGSHRMQSEEGWDFIQTRFFAFLEEEIEAFFSNLKSC